jgi:cytochrome c-type biogenesis protein CcmH/NrfG
MIRGEGHAASLEPARQLLLARRPELAEPELRRFLAACPRSVQGHALLGWCLVMLNRPREAVAGAREAVRLGPDWPYAHGTLAEVYITVHRLSEAEKSARAALALDPDNPWLHGLLAEALLCQRFRFGTREALRATEAGLALNPAHVECARLRAHALSRLRRHEQAREAADYALRLAPERSDTQAAAGVVAVAAGDRNAGGERLREALRLDPGNASALLVLRTIRPGARAASALLVQAHRWRRALACLAPFFVAEVVAVLLRGPADERRYIAVATLVLLGAPAAAMLWAHRFHRPLVEELWLAPRDVPEAREARKALVLVIFLLLVLPLGMLAE